MSALSISLLGSLLIQYGAEPPVHFRARSAQALLIYLAVEARWQRREYLVELLWPGMPSNSGRQNLRQALYELRQVFPAIAAKEGGKPVSLVIADRQTMGVNPQADLLVDVIAFDRLVHSGDPQQQERAVGLYRGDFLEGFYLPDSANFEAWAADKRAAYRRQMLDALGTLADQALAGGDLQGAERFARQQLALDDLRESAVRQLMPALLGQGQRSAALQAYGEMRDRLQEALDVEPAAETTALFKRIQDESLTRPVALEVIASVPASPAHNLPSPETPFIGRRRELAEIEQLLLSPDCRLLTLLGPGGIGKSRLALEVARLLSSGDLFPDGIWFVPLAAIEEAEQILPAIAGPLPFDFFGRLDPEHQLLGYLCDKKLLLLLDNLEQLLLSGPPQLVRTIIARAPGVKLLVTSRAPLRLHGEQLYRLSGLSLPLTVQSPSDLEVGDWGRQFDGIRLFEASARRVQANFSLERGNIAAVLAIGRRVEGFPLGLEMAAAWIEILSPAEIDRELARSFDLLEAEWAAGGDRHHSARAVFEWSWRLLTEEEQVLCQTLSIFRGGFSREAAVYVGQAKLPTLLSLSRKSWLQQDQSGRYQLHQLLRQYALEKLGADEDARQSAAAGHAAYYAAHFASLTQEAHGPGQQEAFAAFERDIENARTAWHWLVDHGQHADIAGSLLPALFTYAVATGYFSEVLALIEEARNSLLPEGRSVAAAGAPHSPGKEDPQLLILALNAAECALQYDYFGGEIFGEATISWDLLQETWPIVERESGRFTTGPWIILITTFYGWMQDRAEGLQRLRRLVSYYQDNGQRWYYAYALQSLGQLLSMNSVQAKPGEPAASLADKEEARAIIGQALREFMALGDTLEQSRTLRLLGYVVYSEDPGAARAYFQEANALLDSPDRSYKRFIYAPLAMSSLSLGEYDEAFRIFADARQQYEMQGNRALLAEAMSLESIQAVRYGDLTSARDLRAAAMAIYRDLGYEISIYYSIYEQGEIERVAGQLALAHDYYEQVLSLFQDLEETHGQAFCRRGLGDLALLAGDHALARRHFEAALSLAQEPYVHLWLTSLAHSRLARALLGLGEYEGVEERLRLAAWYANLRIFEDKELLLIALVEMAALLLVRGQPDWALILGTFVAQHFASWRETKRRAEGINAAAAAHLPEAARQAARERARQLTLTAVMTHLDWV